MAITYENVGQTITLETRNTTYQMKIGQYGYLLHTYYGRKTDGDMSYLIAQKDRGFSGNPYDAGTDRTFSLDQLPQEYPCEGCGDYRRTALCVRSGKGICGVDLRYQGHKITKGVMALPGLPAIHARDEEAMSLALTLSDRAVGIEVTLLYTVLEESDTIERSAIIRNTGSDNLTLQNAASASFDLLYGQWDLIHFHGRHAYEREKGRCNINTEELSILSRRGTSSHQENPFVIIAGEDTNEDQGDCYGLMLLYSGSFALHTSQDQYGQTRVMMGILSERFDYSLSPGEAFTAPSCALIYTSQGFTSLSQHYHALIKEHVIRGPWAHKRRPILINNWEATYFDFNREKLLDIARTAKELGIEMLVLDDGWFANRCDDNRALGDWQVNEQKLGGSLDSLVSEVNKIGLRFGLWIEPEMVSEDSRLYAEHPDWAFTLPCHRPVRGRGQLCLDFSRKEVVDAVFDMISKVIDSAHIEYIKMDMNRSISDVATANGDYQSQGKTLYRYVMGVYDFLERLLKRYPELLIEGCSGGGGRFDAGMLYYTPQIWTSDNTDAIDRLTIQYGTSFGYPVSCMGAHVSTVPNHQSGRSTPFNTRAVVAMAGSFGYEMDLSKLTGEEMEEAKQQIKTFKTYQDLMHNGLYYRLTDPTAKCDVCAWMMVSADQKEAILSFVRLETHGNSLDSYIKLKGIAEDTRYTCIFDGRVYTGAQLMYGGLRLPSQSNEYEGTQLYFTAK